MKRVLTFVLYFVLPALIFIGGVEPACAQKLNNKHREIRLKEQKIWPLNRDILEKSLLRSNSLKKETLIRVRLASKSKLESTTIKTSGPVYIYEAGSKEKQKVANAGALFVDITESGRLRLRNLEAMKAASVELTSTCEIIVDPLPDTTLTFAKHTYKGVFHLLLRDGTIRVVEHNNIDDYLLGVVNPEMSPSAPLEALKAQAIASRSYALTKRDAFKRADFDVVDTPTDQRYIGIDEVTAEVYRAVQETHGLVLKKNGKMLLSLYHANCGGTTSSIPSNYCYFGSVSMPAVCCDGCTPGVRSGHGWGMCQKGAISDAYKHHGFDYILNHYYKEAVISKVY